MNPVTGGGDFEAEGVHAAADKLLGTGHRQTRLEAAHVGGHESGQDTLHSHAEMLRFQRQIAAKLLHKSLSFTTKKITFNNMNNNRRPLSLSLYQFLLLIIIRDSVLGQSYLTALKTP